MSNTWPWSVANDGGILLERAKAAEFVHLSPLGVELHIDNRDEVIPWRSVRYLSIDLPTAPGWFGRIISLHAFLGRPVIAPDASLGLFVSSEAQSTVVSLQAATLFEGEIDRLAFKAKYVRGNRILALLATELAARGRCELWANGSLVQECLSQTKAIRVRSLFFDVSKSRF